MEQFKRETSGFNYVYERKFTGQSDTVVLRMPSVSPNKRSVAAIAWQTEGDIALYATLSSEPEGDNAMWQQINAGEEINGAVTAFKIVEGTGAGKIAIRVIMR